MTLTKTCTRCGIAKDHSEFSVNPQSRDGLTYMCRECNKARCTEWYAGHRDVIARKVRASREEINARRREMYHQRKAAKQEVS
jgi:hypothetical protein